MAGARRRPIYVEIEIATPIADVWTRSQDPTLHERWDLRFTTIEYLPKNSNDEPQRFRYATRIGFGLGVEGAGESTGEHLNDAERVSALRFWSDDPKAIIREGSGYWKYIDEGGRTRFLTLYDYRTRFGAAGAVFDRIVFRPMLGWATALSFDRLRLWIERGIDPAASFRMAAAHGVARVSLALVWIYQGLVPKLIAPEAGELAILEASGVAPGQERLVLLAMGIVEMAFGGALLFWFRSRLLLCVQCGALVMLLFVGAISTPRILATPFNAPTLTIAMVALAIVGLLALPDAATSTRCRRQRIGDA